MLSMGIQACGMAPYDYDQCQFMGDYVIFVMYVDYCLLSSKEDKYIGALVDKMCGHIFGIEYEYQSINGLLSLYIPKTCTGNDNTIKLIIDVHINILLVLTGINVCTPKDTPAIQTPLVPDIDGAPCKETNKWRYESAVVMIHYLLSNARHIETQHQITYHSWNSKSDNQFQSYCVSRGPMIESSRPPIQNM